MFSFSFFCSSESSAHFFLSQSLNKARTRTSPISGLVQRRREFRCGQLCCVLLRRQLTLDSPLTHLLRRYTLTHARAHARREEGRVRQSTHTGSRAAREGIHKRKWFLTGFREVHLGNALPRRVWVIKYERVRGKRAHAKGFHELEVALVA